MTERELASVHGDFDPLITRIPSQQMHLVFSNQVLGKRPIATPRLRLSRVGGPVTDIRIITARLEGAVGVNEARQAPQAALR